MRKDLVFMPQFDGYAIAESEWAQSKDKDLPFLTLSDKTYLDLVGKKPDEKAPVIGILLRKFSGYYNVQQDYVKALIKTGARILFLDHRYHEIQMSFCNGLLLPSGVFETPEWYYSDAKSGAEEYPNIESRVYAECFKYASDFCMPCLGICAGMQVMAAERGLKLYRSQKYFESPLRHMNNEVLAHHIDLLEGTPFRKMMDDNWRLPVNSRHREMLAPIRVQKELLKIAPEENLPLEIYALATDGIPEAIGDMDNGILGVQWHPENYAVAGDQMQQRIFDWLADKASENK